VAAADGDGVDEFVALYRREYGRLVNALTHAGATAGTAEDLAQEAFARTLAHWWRIRAGPNPTGYLYRVGFRLVTSGRRRRVVTGLRPAENGSVGDMAIVHTESDRILAAMPARRRTVAVLCIVLGYTTGEAADTLGIRASTVRKHLGVARSELAAALSGD
jgi:RNA polymerase sigma-70 factor (ECF subfamily)